MKFKKLIPFIILLIVADVVLVVVLTKNYKLSGEASVYNVAKMQTDANARSGSRSNCTSPSLTITALPTPVSQTVAVGTNNFDFAHIQFKASATCDITLTKVVIGIDNNVSNVPAMVRNLKVYDLATNAQVGTTITSPTWANIIGSNLNIQIPAGTAIVLAVKADVVGVGSVVIRMGESYTEAFGTGTTTQVGNGYQYWGQWMKIVAPLVPVCSHGTICFMNGGGTNSVFSFNTSTNTWAQVTANAQWQGRRGERAVVFNNKIWVMGGAGMNGTLNDVWSSPDGVTWTQATAHAPWDARSDFQAVVFNNKIWVMGGNPGAVSGCAGQTCHDVWSSPDGVTWTQMNANAPWAGMDAFGSVVFNNKIWVMGWAPSTGMTGVWSSPDGVTWTQTNANAPWGPRNGFGTLVFNNKIWVMGGSGNNTNWADVWSSPDGVTWTQVSANVPWPPRNGFGYVVLNGKMWIMGGATTGQLYDTWSSSNGTSWTQVVTNGPWNGAAFDGVAVTP